MNSLKLVESLLTGTAAADQRAFLSHAAALSQALYHTNTRIVPSGIMSKMFICHVHTMYDIPYTYVLYCTLYRRLYTTLYTILGCLCFGGLLGAYLWFLKARMSEQNA